MTQPVKDERFIHKKTPRTTGGTTARWRVEDYIFVKAKGHKDTSKSPFKAIASDKDERFVETLKRRGAGWKKTDYRIEKAKGREDMSESPFKTMADPKLDRFSHVNRGTPRWNIVAYKDGLKRSKGVTPGKNSGKNHPLYPKPGVVDTRFDGISRGTPRWDIDHYRAFRKASGAEGSSGGKSPLKVMAEATSEPFDPYTRKNRCGDFSARQAHASFLDNQKTAAAIKRSTSGHGGSGAGEAIFGPRH